MNSEREKLIEIWLDNAGERQYQFAFRNALLSSGFTILHNTSHTALELGKDIIARSPDGDIVAYQLKGNPGGRLNVTQWQELISQIQTLIYQPVSHPEVRPGTIHQPILVTNGEIHENVYAAIASLNAQIAAGPAPAKPLKTLARGQILELILKAAETLWPADIPTQTNILNVFASRGDDEIPFAQFVSILGAILGDKYSDAAIPSAHLITSILAARWIGKSNYYEVVKMYALLAVSAICYQSRWKRKRTKDKAFIREISSDLRTSLLAFVDDLKNNFDQQPLLNRNIFTEFGYYHPRKKMIAGLASVAFLDANIKLDDTTRGFLWRLVCKSTHKKFFGSEAIIPFCLAEFWALSNIQGTIEPDIRINSLLLAILRLNQSEDELRNIPGPYYQLEEIVRWQFSGYLRNFTSQIFDESYHRRSWFAEPLFFLLVRRNYKQWCRRAWPDLTRFIHCRTRLPSEHDYGPGDCQDATQEDYIIHIEQAPKAWDDAIKDAQTEIVPSIPEALLKDPALVLLYCLFVPYRMDRDVILWLDGQFCKTWY